VKRIVYSPVALSSLSDIADYTCDLLMEGVRDAEGLIYCREGSHFLILRERLDALEVVEIFHERMDIGRHLNELLKQPPVDFDG
jgi:plasmid stabilization system protein ParE